jgi:DNA-binding response OmpR family regulator
MRLLLIENEEEIGTFISQGLREAGIWLTGPETAKLD